MAEDTPNDQTQTDREFMPRNQFNTLVSDYQEERQATAPRMPASQRGTDPDKNMARQAWIQQIKQIPEYTHHDEQNLITEFARGDDQGERMRTQVANRILQQHQQEDADFSQWWNNPETEQEKRNQVVRQLKNRSRAASEMLYWDGGDVAEDLTTHQARLRKQEGRPIVDDYKRLMRKNPKDYEEFFGELDKDAGHLGIEGGDSAIRGLMWQDDEQGEKFRRRLMQDKIGDFEQTLSAKHNAKIFDREQNPDEWAKAFHIYDEYGSEALTDYVNMIQFYDPQAGMNQVPTVQNAMRRFSSDYYGEHQVFQNTTEWISGGFEIDDDVPYSDAITRAANKHDLDPALLTAVADVESSFRADVVQEETGATGLFQLMPDTAREMGFDPEDLTDPEVNAEAGAQYLRQMLDQHDGNLQLALSAYNAGPGAVQQYAGVPPFEETQNFVERVAERTEQYTEKTRAKEPLTFTPRERRAERRPADYNSYTVDWHEAVDEHGGDRNRAIKDFAGRQVSALFGEEFRHAPEDEKLHDEMSIEELFEYEKEMRREHEGSHAADDFPEYEDLVWRVAHAIEDEKIGYEEVVQTLAVAGEPIETEERGLLYEFNYDEAEPYVQVLVDAMNAHGNLADMLLYQEGSQVYVEPQRAERRGRQRAFEGFTGFMTPDRLAFETDDFGAIQGVKREVPDSAWNIPGQLAVGVHDFASEMAAFAMRSNERVAHAVGALGEAVGSDAVSDWAQGRAHWAQRRRQDFKDNYTAMTSQFSEAYFDEETPVIGGMNLTDLGAAGGNLLAYLYATFKTGGAVLGRGLDMMGRAVRQGQSMGRRREILQSLQGTHGLTTRGIEAGAAARKFENLKNAQQVLRANVSRSPWARWWNETRRAVRNNYRYNTWPRFAAGTGVLEVATDPDHSLSLMVDQIFRQEMMGLGREEAFDAHRFYRESNAIGKWALDWIGAEILGIMFDGAQGVGKFAKDFGWKRGKNIYGRTYDPKTGNYRTEDRLQFMPFPDMQRYVHNVRQGVEAIPRGDINEAMAAQAGRAAGRLPRYTTDQEATQADMVAHFIKESEPIMSTIRQDLDAGVTEIADRLIGRGRYPREDLDRAVNDAYEHFMENLSRNMRGWLSGGDGRLTAKGFADMLEEAPFNPTESSVVPTADGRVAMSRAEVNNVIKENPNTMAVPVGDGLYSAISNSDPNAWRFDLARRLRQSDDLADFDQTLQDHIGRYGLDQNRPEDSDAIEQLTDQLDQYWGHPVDNGYIAGFNSRGWVVRRPDGSDVEYEEIIFADGTRARPTQPNRGSTRRGEGDQARVEEDPEPTGVVGRESTRTRRAPGYHEDFAEGQRVMARTGRNRPMEEGEIVSLTEGSATVRVRSQDPELDEVYEDTITVPRTQITSPERGIREGDAVQWTTDEGDQLNRGAIVRSVHGQTDTDTQMADIIVRDEGMDRQISVPVDQLSLLEASGRGGRVLDMREVDTVESEFLDNLRRQHEEASQQRQELENQLSRVRDEQGNIRMPSEPEQERLRLAREREQIIEENIQDYERARAQRQAAMDQHAQQVGGPLRAYEQRMEQALNNRNTEQAMGLIPTLRGLGKTSDEIDEMIQTHWRDHDGVEIDNDFAFLQRLNQAYERGVEPEGDRYIMSRINEARRQAYERRRLRLAEQARADQGRRADELLRQQHKENPLAIPTVRDAPIEVDGVNPLLRPQRPAAEWEGVTRYNRRLASELGTDSLTSIGLLQRVRRISGPEGQQMRERVPITEFDYTRDPDDKGNYLTRATGVIVKVSQSDGSMPSYAMARRQSAKDVPTRFTVAEEGGYKMNEYWAFVDVNDTVKPSGEFRRFRADHEDTYDQGIVYREDPEGDFLLNIQKPKNIDYEAMKGPQRDNQLTHSEIMRHNFDGIKSRDDQGRLVYRPVTDEQVKKVAVMPTQDPEPPRVSRPAQTEEEAITKVSKMSKDGDPKLPAHAWLAAPGVVFTGSVGIDEDGQLTPFGYAALGLGMLATGGVLIRSMTGRFKIRQAYDQLNPRQKETFDQFDWVNKVDEQGNFRDLTQEEQAMINRLTGVPKDDFRLMREAGVNIARNTDEYVTLRQQRDDLEQQYDRYTMAQTRLIQRIEDGTVDREYGEQVSGRLTERIESIAEERDTIENIMERVENFDYSEPGGIPTFGVSMQRSVMVDSDYKPSSTYFDFENDVAFPRLQRDALGGRDDRLAQASNQDLFMLEVDHNKGLVTTRKPEHEFTVEADKTSHPHGWARVQYHRDGMILDELQLDSRLQKGSGWDAAGDLGRDFYETILDDVMLQAARHNNGVVYITRGDWQSHRYSLDPDSAAYRENLLNRIRERDPEIDEVTGRDYRRRMYQRINEMHAEDAEMREIFDKPKEAFEFVVEPQNIQRGMRHFYDNKLPSMIEKRYGVRVQRADPEELTQAELENGIPWENANRAFHRVEVPEDAVTEAYGKTTRRLEFGNMEKTALGVGALVGAGGIASAVSDVEVSTSMPEDQQYQQAGLGSYVMLGILGAAAFGMLRGRMVSGARRQLNTQIKRMDQRIQDEYARKSIEADASYLENRDIHGTGLRFNPNDSKSVQRARRWKEILESASRGMGSVMEAVSNSRYAQADSQMLRGLAQAYNRAIGRTSGTNVFHRVHDLLNNHQSEIKKIRRTVDHEFNEERGYGAGEFGRYREAEGIDRIRELTGRPEMTNEAAVDMFNNAVWRIMNRGLRQRSDGTAIMDQDIPATVRQQYQHEQWGAEFQRLDQQLLNDQKFVDWVMSLRKGYNRVKDEWIGIVDGELLRLRDEINNKPFAPETYNNSKGSAAYTHRDAMDLIDRFINMNRLERRIEGRPLDWNDFYKNLSSEQRHLMRKIKKSNRSDFNRLLQTVRTRNQFTDLGDRYFPQQVDHGMIEQVRAGYRRQAEEQGIENPDAWAQERMVEDWAEINGRGMDYRHLLEYNEDSDQLRPKFRHDIEQARTDLFNTTQEFGTPRFRRAMEDELGGPDEQITAERLRERGFIGEDVDAEGNRVYYARMPDDFRVEEEGREVNPFERENDASLKRMFDAMMINPTLRRSRFLENPRQYELPPAWVRKDPIEAWETYSRDAGQRLHAVRHGIFHSDDFERAFGAELKGAMRRAGLDDNQIEERMGRIRESFANQWGIMRELNGMNPNERAEYLRKRQGQHNFMRSIRNFANIRYAWGFKWLNMFQPHMSTLPMTSHRAFKNAMGRGDDSFDHAARRTLEQALEDYHMIQRTNKAMRVDLQENDPTAGGGSFMDVLHRGSKRGADWVFDFDPAKDVVRVDPNVGGSRWVRLATDSFVGTNMMNNSVNVAAFLDEAHYLARIGKQMRDRGLQTYRDPNTGRTFSSGEIENLMQNLGIPIGRTIRRPDGSEVRAVDFFIDEAPQMEGFMRRIKDNKKFELDQMDPDYADLVETLMHHATESYNATNMFNRPGAWNSEIGRTLSQFAGFTFNIGMQVTSRRILQPINHWLSTYSPDGQLGKRHLGAINRAVKAGDLERLRQMGVQDPENAIADFPFHAIDTAQKAIVGTLGGSIATYTTLDIIRDIMAYPVNEALGEPQWRNLRDITNMVVNPWAPENQRVSMFDLFQDDDHAQDIMKLVTWGGATLSRSSVFGMYLSPLESWSKYGFRGTGQVFPGYGITDRTVSDLVSIGSGIGNLDPAETTGEMANFMIDHSPIYSANAFRDNRRALRNAVGRFERGEDIINQEAQDVDDFFERMPFED